MVLADTQPVGTLLGQAKTLDQGKALLQFVEAISERTLRSTVTLTAGRGRGKSATLGLAIAAAVAYGYVVFVCLGRAWQRRQSRFYFCFTKYRALTLL